jgi:hypothetical protein
MVDACSKETPCLRLFKRLFVSSHSIFISRLVVIYLHCQYIASIIFIMANAGISGLRRIFSKEESIKKNCYPTNVGTAKIRFMQGLTVYFFIQKYKHLLDFYKTYMYIHCNDIDITFI